MELVQNYYANERQFALFGVGMGTVLSIVGAVLWRTSATASLGTGMAYVLLIAGILQAAASFSYVVIVDRRTEDARTYQAHSENNVKAQELARMQNVLKSGYTGALVTYTTLLLIGVALVFFAINVPLWKGVALGLMIVGVIGHGIEAFSMQTNRDYKEAVEACAPDWPRPCDPAPRA